MDTAHTAGVGSSDEEKKSSSSIIYNIMHPPALVQGQPNFQSDESANGLLPACSNSKLGKPVYM